MAFTDLSKVILIYTYVYICMEYAMILLSSKIHFDITKFREVSIGQLKQVRLANRGISLIPPDFGLVSF